MWRFGTLAFAVVLVAGCSLLVDTGGLADGPGVSPMDAGADAIDTDDAADAGDAGGEAGPADASADAAANDIVLRLGSTNDAIRINNNTPQLPSQEINAGLGSAAQPRKTGLRFPNVQLQQGASIASAILTLVSSEALAGTMTSTAFSAQASDDAAVWQASLGDFDGRPRVVGRVLWHSLPAWATGATYASPDLAALIQEIVSRPGWAAGHALALFWEDDGSVGADEQRVAFSYQGTATDPVLVIRLK